MNYQKVGFRLILSLLMAAPSAWAGTVVAGEVDAGYQNRNVSANESKFEEYGKVPDGAVIPYVSADASWDQTPHDYSNVGQTLYNQNSPGVLTLPSQVQSNLPTTRSGSSYSPT